MKKIISLLCLVYLFSFIGITSLYSYDIYTFYFQNKKYEIVKTKMSWDSAASYAVSQGGYLVKINNKAEQDTVYNSITKGANISASYTSVNDGGGVAYIWIGATDKLKEGDWLWDGNNDNQGELFWTGQGLAGSNNGKVVNGKYVNWGGTSAQAYVEPDDYAGNQDAAAIALEAWPKGSGGNGIASEWNDISRNNTIYFVIEYDNPPKLDKPDSNSINNILKPTFYWYSTNADTYYFQLSQNSDFSNKVIDDSVIVDTSIALDEELLFNTKYYWRVKCKKSDIESKWSNVWSFTTAIDSTNFHKLSFQGILRDTNLQLVSDGLYSLTFKIYTKKIGGTSVWSETQNVNIIDGLLDVSLGEVNPIILPFNTSYWIGISIGNDPELSPRKPLLGPVYNIGFGR